MARVQPLVEPEPMDLGPEYIDEFKLEEILLRRRKEALSFTIDVKEPVYIDYLQQYLNAGGDIDALITPINNGRLTILLRAICRGLQYVVKYVIENGAKIEKEVLFEQPDIREKECQGRSWNALEIAIWKYSIYPVRDNYVYENIYETLRAKSLENFSVYGLNPLYLECALGRWYEVEKLLNSTAIEMYVNSSINANSPIWPGHTPLLLAAKFNRTDVVARLLDLGASPKVRDSMGNTPLHYLARYNHCDERLFIYDEEDTFSKVTGMSHFHIACQFRKCDVVRCYLKLGICPNIQVRKREIFGKLDKYFTTDVMYETGETGLHIAGPKLSAKILNRTDPSLSLVQLLLEYGANVDQKDAKNKSPLHKCVNVIRNTCDYPERYHCDYVKCMRYSCLLIESGAKSDPALKVYSSRLPISAMRSAFAANLILLRCLKRVMTLRRDKVSREMKRSIKSLHCKSLKGIFCIDNYTELCTLELSILDSLDLRRELEDTEYIKRDFKMKFGELANSPDLPRRFPIYGHLLQIKLKKRLFQYEKKKQRIDEAAPYLASLAQPHCNLNFACTEHILKYLSINELDKFIEVFDNPKTVQ